MPPCYELKKIIQLLQIRYFTTNQMDIKPNQMVIKQICNKKLYRKWFHLNCQGLLGAHEGPRDLELRCSGLKTVKRQRWPQMLVKCFIERQAEKYKMWYKVEVRWSVKTELGKRIQKNGVQNKIENQKIISKEQTHQAVDDSDWYVAYAESIVCVYTYLGKFVTESKCVQSVIRWT